MSKAGDSEVLLVDGREVAVTNPDKVLFAEAGHTKLDLVHYYLAVADGALRGAGGRPNVLVRYPNGIGGEFFYQKRAPQSRPDWIEVVALQFPSGRTAEEVVPRDAAALAWMANLACLELHPHPCPGRRPRSSRRAAHRSRPGARCRVAAGARGRGGRARYARRSVARRLAEDVRLARHSRDTCGSNSAGRSRRSGGRRSPSRARSSAAPLAWRRANGGRRSATACSSTTTRTRRTAPSPQRIRCGRSRTHACRHR